MKNWLIAFLMSVAFFSCKSQTKELDNYKTIYFSDSVVMFNNENDTVKHFLKDKYLLVIEDSTLYVLNNTKKKAYKVNFYRIQWICFIEIGLMQNVIVYKMKAVINDKDTTLITIAFYADDANNRVHTFGMKIADGKIIIVKIKRPKEKMVQIFDALIISKLKALGLNSIIIKLSIFQIVWLCLIMRMIQSSIF